VLQNVSVLPMTSETLLQRLTVHVRNGVIEWMGSADAEPARPAGAIVVPGDGRVLMPALMDMHVHILEPDLRAYVAHGIGTVRNMWGHLTVRTLRDEIAQGTRFGPTIITVSPGLDAPPVSWPVTQIVTTPDEARTVIAAIKAVGYTDLKMYNNVSRAMFDTVMKLAGENDMRVVGHVPTAVPVRHALSAGMRSLEHLGGYDADVRRPTGNVFWVDVDETRYASLVQATVAAGAWNCPTLAIYVELFKGQPAAVRDPLVRNRRRFTKALFDGGARILAGSDAGALVLPGPNGQTLPMPAGVSLHQELEEFVAAGLTPYQALRIATVGAAAYFGRGDLGRVEMGARGDLVLLAENPLQDVRRARNIGGVVLAGAWTPQRELLTRTTGTRSP
jgi:imidazolonepropionase-like amidohydrolase